MNDDLSRTPTVTNASAAAAPGASELPPLPARTALTVTTPDAKGMVEVMWYASQYSSQKEPLFTADQMREYAQLALAGQCGARQEPVAWARKWHIDGETPAKKKNGNGRWAWPQKFKFYAVTPHKVFKDDVPLYASPVSAQGAQAEVKIERGRVWIVRGNQSFMLAYEPEEGDDPVEMQVYADNLRAALCAFTPCVKSVSAQGALKSDAKRMESDGARQEPVDPGELAFNATRLRNVARLVGLESAIPEDDATLDGARGSVLGLIAGTLRGLFASPVITQPEHETIVREGDKLVCTTCGTSAGAQQGDVRAAVLEEAAKLVIKFTAVPRDVLGPATVHMKTLAAVGKKIADAIRALAAAPAQAQRGTPKQHAALQKLADIAQANDMGYGAPAQAQDGGPTCYRPPRKDDEGASMSMDTTRATLPRTAEGERAAFEAWAVSRAKSLERTRDGEGEYAEYATQAAWTAWIARSALESSTEAVDAEAGRVRHLCSDLGRRHSSQQRLCWRGGKGMSTDRELLELASKAAGISLLFSYVDADLSPRRADTLDLWNPLTDDGDAFRLAAKLELDVMHRVVSGKRIEVHSTGGPLIMLMHFYEGDTAEAMRQAIILAAAEIGSAQAATHAKGGDDGR